MKIIKRNLKQQGFAHPLVLVLLLVGVVGVVVYSGQRAIRLNNQTDEQSFTKSSQSPIIITSGSDETSEDSPRNLVNIKRAGSAAEVSNNNEPIDGRSSVSLPSSTEVSSDYDVPTPIGSLSQLIYEAKQNDFSSALYFITPRLMFSAYETLNAQNVNDFKDKCQSNDICNTLLSTNVEIDVNHISEDYCSPPANSSFTECKKIGTKFVVEDGKIKTVYYKTVGYHVHEASINMLYGPNSSNWVIDQISVDGFTI